MPTRLVPFEDRKRMTYLGEALAERLSQSKRPIISNYELFSHLWTIYAEGNVKYLRGEHLTHSTFERTRDLLKQENIIYRDRDYAKLWRITDLPDVPAEEAICLAHPYGYISHLSAMQRYGLTNRRPEALFITLPEAPFVRAQLQQKRQAEYADALDSGEIFVERIHAVTQPPTVRGRPVTVLTTKHFGDWRPIRGTFARIGSIGQTFLDMMETPERCGGMRHILEVWEDHATTYLEEIIGRFDHAPRAIHKLRAGYVLEERLGVSDSRVLSWKALAQRGGSQVLDPEREYVDNYSEDWMISVNV